MRFVNIFILLFINISLQGFAQSIERISVKLDTINAKNILTLQKDNHLLGIEVLKNQGHFIKGNKISDTLYIYIHKKNAIDSLVTNLSSLEQDLRLKNTQYYKEGLIFNKLKADSIVLKQKKLHIHYILKNSNYLQIDSLSFSKKLPKNVLKNIHKRFLSKRITKQNIMAIRHFIHSNTTFSTNEKSHLFFRKNKNILDFTVQTIQKNSIDGLLGFKYDNEKNKLSIDGEVNGVLYNTFNSNEKIHFRWQKHTQIQNYLVDVSFPFIMGSNYGISNSFLLQRKDSTEIAVFNRFEVTWRSKNHRIGIHYIIDNKNHITKGLEKNEYLGLAYNINWLSKINLERFGFFNQIINGLSINTKENNFGYFVFNKINFAFKTFKRQGIKIAGINYYSNENFASQFITTKSDLFIYNYRNIEDIKSLQIFKSAYYFVNKNQIFYSIHDFVNENTLNNMPKTYINLGIGTQILRKKQNLTLQVFVPIFISKTTDNQDVYISIKQTLRF